MALSAKQVAEIVGRYNAGEGDDVEALASAYEVGAAAIRYQLKKAGVFKAEAESAKLSDADLGIEHDDAPHGPAPAAMADLLKNPAFAALIDQAVAQRLAQMGGAPAAPVNETTSVVKAIERLLEVQALQQPGYIKPISVGEMDRRAAGHVEMLAQIEHARARNAQTGSKDYIPHYILGTNFYECTNAILYAEGSEIRTFIQPGESFVPMNETARLIHAAMITSIGGPSPEIGARIAEAMLAAKDAGDIPVVGSTAPNAGPNAVEIVPTAKRHDVSPKRVLGSITPETRGTSMPVQPGVTQQPSGPVFVG